MEFSHRKQIAEVGWSTICNGELVNGDTLILMVSNLIKVFLAGAAANKSTYLPRELDPRLNAFSVMMIVDHDDR